MDLRSLIAQHHLAASGHYTGALDGIWGPLSKAAAIAWQDIESAAAAPDTVPGAPTPFDLARRHLGEKEIPGKANNPLILRWLRFLAGWISDEETPWCSAFVDAMAREAGYERTGKLNARSWLDCGLKVTGSQVRQGDVVILWRVSPTSWEGHVGFVHAWSPSSSQIRILGGNQSNAVSIASYPSVQILGFRRLRSLTALEH